VTGDDHRRLVRREGILQLEFTCAGQTVSIAVVPDGADWRLSIDGRELSLQAAPRRDGAWLVDTPQGRRRLWVAVRGQERLVFCDGRVHVLRIADPDQDDDTVDVAGAPGLMAAMPGKVVKVLVAAGETVAAGQVVMTMESMKMETEVAAGRAGVVERIHVQAGDLVAQGDVLATMAPVEDGEPA
jgi:acetyl/propionyl-CoA carboxylase alpha subunit